ncbi:MAG: hypothetical protein K2O06_02935 [Acetatifactor sp.]|nr:hypothetical protein [Acetatifactor sp.]
MAEKQLPYSQKIVDNAFTGRYNNKACVRMHFLLLQKTSAGIETEERQISERGETECQHLTS